MREGAGSQVVLGQGLSVSLRFLWLHYWGLLPPAFTALLPLHWQCENTQCLQLPTASAAPVLALLPMCLPSPLLLPPPRPAIPPLFSAFPGPHSWHHHSHLCITAVLCWLLTSLCSSLPLCCSHTHLSTLVALMPALPAHPLLCYWLMRTPATAINKGTLTLSVVWGQGRSGPCRTG